MHKKCELPDDPSKYNDLKHSVNPIYICKVCSTNPDTPSHPHPISTKNLPVIKDKNPCKICAVPVRKKVIFCQNCNAWFHKKCELPDNPEIYNTLVSQNFNTPYICTKCQKNQITRPSEISNPNLLINLPFSGENNIYDLYPDGPEDSPEIYFDENSSEKEDLNYDVFKKRGLHFLHININSILSKIEEVKIIALKTNATVIGISESKLDESVLNSEISIPSYNILRCDRNRNGGGVLCYVKNTICYNQREHFSNEFENIFFDILLPNTKPILVGNIYRPPDQLGFLEKLSNAILNAQNFDSQEVYILGDFNIDLSKKGRSISNSIKKYREFCAQHGLKQLIKNPTRITKNTSTILDHILTNSEDKIFQVDTLDIGLSDHQLIYCTRKKCKEITDTKTYIKYRSLKNYSPEILKAKLQNLSFPDYSTYANVNEGYADLLTKVDSVIDEIAPIKEMCVKNNTAEWIDGDVFEAIRIRDKKYQRFKRTRLHVDHVNFKQLRNNVQKLIKNKKRTYIRGKLTENIGNSKELWKTIKKLGLPSKNETNSKISLGEGGNISFDPKQNANKFKEYFANLSLALVKKLPIATNKFGIETINEYYRHLNLEANNFNFTDVEEDHILTLLLQINPSKAVGIDNLGGQFLRDGATELSRPVSQLINLSISSSIFPNQCKIAKLKPLYKKGSAQETKNYRPISLLPLLSKIFEIVIHEQTQGYLDQHNILYKYQSGFRTKHSTDTCLSLLNNKILSGIDNGKLTGMVLIDLQKAFDTIDHEIFFKKLTCLGFSQKSISWYKSYLSKRTFQVNIENEYSLPGELSCGVPQGSILGPLIFLLYVNDMSMSVDCDLFLYADDSCLVFTATDLKTIEETLNENFNSLCDWFVENKLSIHFGEDKTKSIIFGSKKKLKNLEALDIQRGDIKIKQYSEVTYLGCELDASLSGQTMATKVLGKINGRLKFLYRKQSFLSHSIRRLLCNALIQPHFDYACSAWYPNLNKKFKKKIQVSQNKCIRFCLSLGNRTHIGVKEFKKINWLPTRERFEQCVCVGAFKFYNNLAPLYISDIFEKQNTTHCTRRSTNMLKQMFRNKNHGQKSLSYLGPKFWNALPSKIKDSPSSNIFKHAIKKEFFDQLEKCENDPFCYPSYQRGKYSNLL